MRQISAIAVVRSNCFRLLCSWEKMTTQRGKSHKHNIIDFHEKYTHTISPTVTSVIAEPTCEIAVKNLPPRKVSKV